MKPHGLNDETRRQLDRFLQHQQTQAYQMTYALTGNRDDALELVQDAMLQLVRKYAHKPETDWPALFHRILQNRIRDFHRKQGFRKLLGLFNGQIHRSEQEHSDAGATAIEQASDPRQAQPDQQLQQSHFRENLLQALQTLPLRQQQIFLLRGWQQFSTTETAAALGISSGSVKTHYSRALEKLRTQLGEHHENVE